MEWNGLLTFSTILQVASAFDSVGKVMGFEQAVQ